MTITSAANKVQYTGNGSTKTFIYDFKILEESHLMVYLDSVLQATGYSVTGVGEDAGGTVVFTTAPAVGALITLIREVPLTQVVDYVPYDAFPAQTHETALDKLTMIVQQQEEELDRCFKSPIYENTPPDLAAASGISVVPVGGIQSTNVQDALAELDAEKASIPINAVDVVYDPIGTHTTTVQRKLRESVSVRDRGAFGDGVADDAAAFQEAIDHAATFADGGTVVVTDGIYRIGTTINMKTNVTVRCTKAAKIVIDHNFTSGITFNGSKSSNYLLSVAAKQNDTQITVDGSPPFVTTSIIQLRSAKNCLNRVDAGLYWLGDGTESLPTASFAEWNRIKGVGGAGVFTLARPIIFPSYPINATGETEPARAASEVTQITPCSNAHWIGGRITHNVAGQGENTFFSSWAHRCTVEDCRITRGRVYGQAIKWAASWECAGIRVVNENDHTYDWQYDPDHGMMNRFRTEGSQDCGFIEVQDSYGAQSVDHTYSGIYDFSNVRPFCRDGIFNRCYEGIASHPGCYEESWIRNRILNVTKDGIVIRGSRPVAYGNLIVGTHDGKANSTITGITLAYGAAQFANIFGNTVRNVGAAFEVVDSATLDWTWQNCYINIHHNEVSECWRGLNVNIALSVNAFPRHINYQANHHSLMGRYVVYLAAYTAGCSIKDNVLDGAFISSAPPSYFAFVYMESNNPGQSISGNVWRRPKGSNATITKYMVFGSNLTDQTTYPSADWLNATEVFNNTASFAVADAVVMISINQTAYQMLSYGRHGEPAFGFWTPTIINGANVSANIAYECMFSRIGDVVTFSGSVGITATTASILTSVRLSLPVPSNFVAGRNVGGTIITRTGANLGTGGTLSADVTNDEILADVKPATTEASIYYFSGSYRVLA